MIFLCWFLRSCNDMIDLVYEVFCRFIKRIIDRLVFLVDQMVFLIRRLGLTRLDELQHAVIGLKTGIADG